MSSIVFCVNGDTELLNKFTNMYKTPTVTFPCLVKPTEKFGTHKT